MCPTCTHDQFSPASANAAGVVLPQIIWIRGQNRPDYMLRAAELLLHTRGPCDIVPDTPDAAISMESDSGVLRVSLSATSRTHAHASVALYRKSTNGELMLRLLALAEEKLVQLNTVVASAEGVVVTYFMRRARTWHIEFQNNGENTSPCTPMTAPRLCRTRRLEEHTWAFNRRGMLTWSSPSPFQRCCFNHPPKFIINLSMIVAQKACYALASEQLTEITSRQH